MFTDYKNPRMHHLTEKIGAELRVITEAVLHRISITGHDVDAAKGTVACADHENPHMRHLTERIGAELRMIT